MLNKPASVVETKHAGLTKAIVSCKELPLSGHPMRCPPMSLPGQRRGKVLSAVVTDETAVHEWRRSWRVCARLREERVVQPHGCCQVIEFGSCPLERAHRGPRSQVTFGDVLQHELPCLGTGSLSMSDPILERCGHGQVGPPMKHFPCPVQVVPNRCNPSTIHAECAIDERPEDIGGVICHPPNKSDPVNGDQY